MYEKLFKRTVNGGSWLLPLDVLGFHDLAYCGVYCCCLLCVILLVLLYLMEN
jgi:hypothetical protein